MWVHFLVCLALGGLSVMPLLVHAMPLAATELSLPTKGTAATEDPDGEDMQKATDSSGFEEQEQEQDMQVAADSSGNGKEEQELDMQMAADNSGYGRLEREREKSKLRMFPKIHRTALAAHGGQSLHTKDLLNFWVKEKPHKATQAAPKNEDDAELELRAGKGKGGGAAATAAGKAGTEMTISLPNVVTDHMGNWVFNPWGVTFGRVWEDTRFAFQGKHWLPWIMQDYYIKGDYRQEKLHGTVCQGKSTIYNYPKIYNWFPHYIDGNKRNHRNILLNLRREIYTDGRTESCHVKELDDWYAYQQCTILRNMRMDYLVPNYPLHRWYKP
ncbi:uncharacterized protein LOC117898148 [Drosophila subobscura]|uniref:uncharacterized protein LOC117898148 n=1 Tax=Drosophila subobscura TaxID=7241 RepID=UPI00155A68F9|nr:uncharacterized protein LOC117898148 [Drosophila subobscura]